MNGPRGVGRTLLLLDHWPASDANRSPGWLTREISRSAGRYPLQELEVRIEEPFRAFEWSELRQLCSDERVVEIVVGYPPPLEVLRVLVEFTRAEGLRLSMEVGSSDASAGPRHVGKVSHCMTVLACPIHRARVDVGESTPRSRIRRIFDLVGAVALGMTTLPIVLAAALAIRIDSPGRILFRQMRIGAGGRAFPMWKLRTMAESAPPYARSPVDGDARVTRVGRFLRATGIDELPQFLNVIRGEMGLVGPRPEMPFVVEGYTTIQRQRLAALPGITGLWQLRGDRCAAMHQQIEYDLYYVAFRSVTLDLRILLETVYFAARGARRALAKPSPADAAGREGAAVPHTHAERAE